MTILEYFVCENSKLQNEFKIKGMTFFWSEKGLCRVLFGVPNRLDRDSFLRRHFGDYQIRPASKTRMGNVQKWLKQYTSNPKNVQPLENYFDLQGTDFQKSVWKELLKIPLGHVASYADIAKRCQKPDASRAVGTACGANPISLMVPCHRVLGSSGKLGGFASGLPLKKRLLHHEGVHV